jgi:hypothetical protein
MHELLWDTHVKQTKHDPKQNYYTEQCDICRALRSIDLDFDLAAYE